MALQNDSVNFEDFVGMVESTEKQKIQTSANQKGFEVPDCVGIGNKAIVRFVNGIAETALDQGKPGSGRAKLFNIGWVRDDNDKPFLLTLPAIINGKSMYQSTMSEFIDKVLSRSWVENPDAKDGEKSGEYRYLYENREDFGQQQSGNMTLKQIFWKVFKSGVDPNSQFYKSARSWRGQTIYVANVIDRLDYSWHKEHKSTKLLMRKVEVKADRINRKEVSFFAIGTPLKELTDNHGISLNYDVMITPGAQPTDKFTLRNVSKLKEKDYWDDVKSLVTDTDKAAISTNTGFTEEEATWNPIDIDKYYRFTTAGTILKHFGKTIKSFDMMVGTNFYDRIKEEADADAKFRKANAENSSESTNESAAVETKAETKAAPVQPSFDTMQAVPQQAVPQQAAAQTAPQYSNFEAVQANGAPAPVEPSVEVQNEISSFYDTLD